ncbi:MAG: prenyltransferase/squalene oxidase repeat-containing protein, partial [Actinomycetota bacterium]
SADDDESAGSLAEVIPALVAIGDGAPESLVAALGDARLEDGGWGGDEGSTTALTASAVGALIAAGVPVEDERVVGGLRVLAQTRNEDGGWGPDAESTATDTAAAMSALRAAGYDPDAECWVDDLDAAPGRPTPTSALVGMQEDSGSWGSGDEARSTAVAVQALGDRWLPLARAGDGSCGGGLAWPFPSLPPELFIVAGIGAVAVYGGSRIMREHQPAY